MTTTMGFLRNDNHTESKYTNTHIAPQDYKHVLITGDTGSGKTASLIMPILQHRINTNSAVVFFDYKGHEHKKIKQLAWKNNRLNDIIELGKPTGAYINILALFDSNLLNNAIIKLCGGTGRDPYWSTSAAQISVRIVELHRKLHSIGNTLVKTFHVDANIFSLSLSKTLQGDFHKLTLNEEASFATLGKIIHTPESLTQYFQSLKNLTKKLDKLMPKIYQHFHTDAYQSKIRYIISQIQIFKDMVNKYTNFVVSEDSDEIGGNNSVLQILNNAISLTASTDFINKNQVDLIKEIENNAIIVIDIQSMHMGIYSIFVESLLQKLTARIKYGNPKSVSVFLDEANRVLDKDMDLHNDVLREAHTELILAAQNEEQMTMKFGITEWKALSKNIIHKYEVKSNYNIFYNTHLLPPVTPLLFDDRTLRLAEKKYNALAKSQSYIENKFIFDSPLPKYFNILFDANSFFQNQMIEIHTLDGSIIYATYVGEDIKKKTESQIEILEQEKDTTCIPISSVFHFKS